MVTVATHRPVGAVDAVWLNMDRPNNLMVIDSVMWFDEPVSWERLKRVVQTRLVEEYPVFHQRLSSGSFLGLRQWEDDPDFRLTRHLRRVTLPAPGDEAALQRYIERQMHKELDRAHPLWQFVLVGGYGKGSAIVTRFHHALADGIALAQVLMSLTDATDVADLEGPADHPAPSSKGSRASVTGLAAQGVRGAVGLLSGFPRLARPTLLLDALTLAGQTGHVADKLLLGSNPPTPLSGTPGIAKRAVWSSPRRVADIKQIGRLEGATVNDVLVGAVSGAISAYLVSHGGEATDLTTMVPVNLRPDGEPLPRELGNRFALVLLPLATGMRAPLARLAETKRRMDAIKHSPEAAITFGIVNALGRTNPGIERFLVDFFSSKAIGVTTNVIGPMTHRYVAGSRIAGVLGWVPGSGNQTLGVCIFSYNQTVRVGFKVDAALVPHPEQLVDVFDQEMDDLLRMARAI